MEQIKPDIIGNNFADDPGCMRNVTLQRYQFNSRTQLPDESVEQFAAVLHTLAESCQYGIMKNELIRDRIIAGLSDTTILEKLQQESCLSLENVVAIAREAEIERSQHVKISQDSSSAVELNCAGKRSEEQQFSNEKSNGSKTLDRESREYNNCGKTGDLAIGGEPESVSCTKTKDSQHVGNDQHTHSFAGRVEKTAEISDDSSLSMQQNVGTRDMYNLHEDEESRVKGVYETVQQLMNDLKLQNLNELVERIRTLQINSQAVKQIKKTLAPKRDSQQGKLKSNKPTVIHVSSSLREEIKLRETENPWRRGRLKPSEGDEEDVKTEALYKRVRGVLNKLTPQKFATLVNQVRALKIDSKERLQGVVNMVFDRAVDEPSFCVAYALMCKELAMMQVSGPDGKPGKEESSVNFRKLIITRCQMEFEKNTVDENARAIKLKEIEACADPEKKKELQHILTEEEGRIRIKSVGNIRFIGELFKQGMLTTNIMHRCIRHLLTQIDEESLECLCKLLSTIGKDLESKNQNLDPYFKQMLDIVIRKVSGKVSSKVRFMLEDVIELWLNKWIPRGNRCN